MLCVEVFMNVRNDLYETVVEPLERVGHRMTCLAVCRHLHCLQPLHLSRGVLCSSYSIRAEWGHLSVLQCAICPEICVSTSEFRKQLGCTYNEGAYFEVMLDTMTHCDSFHVPLALVLCAFVILSSVVCVPFCCYLSVYFYLAVLSFRMLKVVKTLTCLFLDPSDM